MCVSLKLESRDQLLLGFVLGVVSNLVAYWLIRRF